MAPSHAGRSLRRVGRSLRRVGRSLRRVGRSLRRVGRSLRRVGRSLRRVGRSLLLGAFVAVALFFLSLLFVRPAPRVQPLFIDGDNPHPFRFLLNEEDVCKRRPGMFVLAVVCTSLGNYKRRMLIRETWASQQLYDRVKTVVLFAMGSADDEGMMNSVKLESERYRDIIQEDFLDSYRNLTYKSVMLLKWASLYCPEALFVLKVDDDVFVNIFNLVSHLHSLHKRNLANKRSILCHLWIGVKVHRDKASKWYVKPEDYANAPMKRRMFLDFPILPIRSNEYYPAYCAGPAYVLSSDLTYPLYRASLTTKFFWMEDIYVTGLLPRALDVNYTNMASLYVMETDELLDPLVDGYALFGHVPGALTIDRRALLWRQLLHNRGLNPDAL